MPKLTKRTVDALKPHPGRDLVVFDSEVSGFGVRVKSSGRKSYLIQYRNAGGRSRRLTIAGHGRMTADEARDEAKQLLAAAARGQDPAEDRHRALRAPTVAQRAALYLERHARPRKKTAIADESRLRRYVLPAFGARKVEAITRGDVARLHHELGDKPLAANRVLALISVMFNLAESWGLRAPGSNPCRHLKRYPERKRDRFLSAEEVQRLGEALLEAQGTEHPSALAAIRLLLLTGARKSEILTLKWEHVDLERYALRLPDSKTGAKVIALGRAAGRRPAADGGLPRPQAADHDGALRPSRERSPARRRRPHHRRDRRRSRRPPPGRSAPAQGYRGPDQGAGRMVKSGFDFLPQGR